MTCEGIDNWRTHDPNLSSTIIVAWVNGYHMMMISYLSSKQFLPSEYMLSYELPLIPPLAPDGAGDARVRVARVPFAAARARRTPRARRPVAGGRGHARARLSYPAPPQGPARTQAAAGGWGGKGSGWGGGGGVG